LYNDRLSEIARLGPKTSILPFPVVGRCHNRPGSVSSSWPWSKTLICCWNCHPACHSSRLSYFRFWRTRCHFRLSIIVAITWRHFIRALHGQESRTCRWNFDAICCSASYVIISGPPVLRSSAAYGLTKADLVGAYVRGLLSGSFCSSTFVQRTYVRFPSDQYHAVMLFLAFVLGPRLTLKTKLQSLVLALALKV